MEDSPRLQELRRRVQQDPASLAFAPLAEELRRAGRLGEAVEVCRTGLAAHPEYVSARVTLGRALVDGGEIANGLRELSAVLEIAPANLAALRGLADGLELQGDEAGALEKYRRALEFAPQDPELRQAVDALEANLQRRAEQAPPSRTAPGGVVRHLEAWLEAILADRVRRSGRSSS